MIFYFHVWNRLEEIKSTDLIQEFICGNKGHRIQRSIMLRTMNQLNIVYYFELDGFIGTRNVFKHVRICDE